MYLVWYKCPGCFLHHASVLMVAGQEAQDAWTPTSCQNKPLLVCQGKITSLTVLPQGKYQCTTAITTVWLELRGPFLRALLLATVELSARAMAALISTPGQHKLLCYVPFFFEKRKVFPPPPAPTLPPSSITKLKITHLFILYEYLFTCIN